ncbi:hypothetical protein GALL_531430 [mine drainage metagenome]|uniref:Uncharacterized protein n=1 Tax=mine drainage metagenome TaxID=410659 RepID=A0A1J5PCS2_9ZZZZ
MAVEQIVKHLQHGLGTARSKGARASGFEILRPERPPRAALGQLVSHGAKILGEERKLAEQGRKVFLHLGFDRARQHGCRTLGANRHHHRGAVNDGGRDEVAVFQVIDDIDQGAIGLRQCGHAGVSGLIPRRDIGEPRALGIARHKVARDLRDAPFGGKCGDGGTG